MIMIITQSRTSAKRYVKIFDVDCLSVIFEFNFSPFDLKMESYLNIVCLFFPLS